MDDYGNIYNSSKKISNNKEKENGEDNEDFLEKYEKIKLSYGENNLDSLIHLTNFVCKTPIASIFFCDKDNKNFYLKRLKKELKIKNFPFKDSILFNHEGILEIQDLQEQMNLNLSIFKEENEKNFNINNNNYNNNNEDNISNKMLRNSTFSNNLKNLKNFNNKNINGIQNNISNNINNINKIKSLNKKISFYCGISLVSNQGVKIGTLFVMDYLPRKFKTEEKSALEIIAKQIMINIEINKLYKELNTANEKTKKLNKVKDEFLNNMSHELRTPLNAIYGFTQILQNSEIDQNQQEYLDIIKSSVENLISLIDDIIDFSLIEKKKFFFSIERFNIRNLFNTLYEKFKKKAIEKDLYFSYFISPKVPKFLVGDKKRLNQVVEKLIGNAIKFTDKGQINFKIECEIITSNKIQLFFNISDTGIGIEEKNLQKIFERFEHGSTDISRLYGGSGLGLSISKKLIELQGGKISVKSQENKGSEFSFNIPYKFENDNPALAFEEYRGFESDINSNIYNTILLNKNCEANINKSENRRFKSLFEKNNLNKNPIDIHNKENNIIEKENLSRNENINNNNNQFNPMNPMNPIAMENNISLEIEDFENDNSNIKSNGNNNLENNIDSDSELNIIIEENKYNEEKITMQFDNYILDSSNYFNQFNDKEKIFFDNNNTNNNIITNNSSFYLNNLKDLNNSKGSKFSKTNSEKSLIEMNKNNDKKYSKRINPYNEKKKINILLCEDNKFNIKLIENLFAEKDYKNYFNLDVALNGKIGIEKIEKNNFCYDLILMDLQMPIMDGMETTNYIRNKLKLEVPIIAMTANTDPNEKINYLKNGMNDYFNKPFKKDEFFSCIENLISEKLKRIKENNTINNNNNNFTINIKSEFSIPAQKDKEILNENNNNDNEKEKDNYLIYINSKKSSNTNSISNNSNSMKIFNSSSEKNILEMSKLDKSNSSSSKKRLKKFISLGSNLSNMNNTNSSFSSKNLSQRNSKEKQEFRINNRIKKDYVQRNSINSNNLSGNLNLNLNLNLASNKLNKKENDLNKNKINKKNILRKNFNSSQSNKSNSHSTRNKSSKDRKIMDNIISNLRDKYKIIKSYNEILKNNQFYKNKNISKKNNYSSNNRNSIINNNSNFNNIKNSFNFEKEKDRENNKEKLKPKIKNKTKMIKPRMKKSFKGESYNTINNNNNNYNSNTNSLYKISPSTLSSRNNLNNNKEKNNLNNTEKKLKTKTPTFKIIDIPKLNINKINELKDKEREKTKNELSNRSQNSNNISINNKVMTRNNSKKSKKSTKSLYPMEYSPKNIENKMIFKEKNKENKNYLGINYKSPTNINIKNNIESNYNSSLNNSLILSKSKSKNNSCSNKKGEKNNKKTMELISLNPYYNYDYEKNFDFGNCNYCKQNENLKGNNSKDLNDLKDSNKILIRSEEIIEQNPKEILVGNLNDNNKKENSDDLELNNIIIKNDTDDEDENNLNNCKHRYRNKYNKNKSNKSNSNSDSLSREKEKETNINTNSNNINNIIEKKFSFFNLNTLNFENVENFEFLGIKGKIEDNKISELSENFEMQKINYQILKEFTDDDIEFEMDMVKSFLEEIPLQLNDLKACLEKRNFEEIRKACHKMKSPISYYGLNNLREKLISVEDFSKMIERNIKVLDLFYDNVKKQIDDASINLKEKYDIRDVA